MVNLVSEYVDLYFAAICTMQPVCRSFFTDNMKIRIYSTKDIIAFRTSDLYLLLENFSHPLTQRKVFLFLAGQNQDIRHQIKNDNMFPKSIILRTL
jgi:hypothetical protein